MDISSFALLGQNAIIDLQNQGLLFTDIEHLCLQDVRFHNGGSDLKTAGGAVEVKISKRLGDGATLRMWRTKIWDSEAQYGGAINTQASARIHIVVFDCLVERNMAKYGGGAYFEGLFAGNEKESDEENIARFQASATTMEPVDSRINGNTATLQAGGLEVIGASRFVMRGSSVSSNAVQASRDSQIGTENKPSIGGLKLSGCEMEVVILDSVVSGNRIVGGSELLGGGGVFAEEIKSITLHRSTLSHNRGAHRGGGALLEGVSMVRIEETFISDNRAIESGGGMHFQESHDNCKNSRLTKRKDTDVFLRGCTVSANSADSGGGGLCFRDVRNATLFSMRVAGNVASGSGGGIKHYTSGSSSRLATTTRFLRYTMLLSDSHVSNNSAESGGGVSADATARYHARGSQKVSAIVLQSTVLQDNQANNGGLIGPNRAQNTTKQIIDVCFSGFLI